MSEKKPIFINIRTVKCSPSINRLFVTYKQYVSRCILDRTPIETLEKFYWANRDNHAVPTSRIFEKYLREVNIHLK